MNWKQAFVLGLISPGAWDGKGEPVAYLYNGVRLPKLPEWDKTAYPYAVIISNGDDYYLGYGSIKLTAGSTGRVTLSLLGSSYSTKKLVDGQWITPDDYLEINIGTPVWANYDVYYTDSETAGTLAGTLLLSASDPVPVYE